MEREKLVNQKKIWTGKSASEKEKLIKKTEKQRNMKVKKKK